VFIIQDSCFVSCTMLKEKKRDVRKEQKRKEKKGGVDFFSKP
jgi:hypothetical protein